MHFRAVSAAEFPATPKPKAGQRSASLRSSPAAKQTIVQCAVENNITDNAFTALIKKYCGIDVINSISIKHQAEEK